MVIIILPADKILTGQPLNELYKNIEILGGTEKAYGEGLICFESDTQSILEIILTHENVMLIAENGGDIEGYLMIAEIPRLQNGESVYGVSVPVGVPNRTMRITDGVAIVEMVKNVSQWCDSYAEQSFSEDLSKIYMNTSPQNDYLKASELKIFVDELSVRLLTLTESKLIPKIT